MEPIEANNSINSDLIRGHIDTIILKALQAGDRYGYDIIKEIEHKSDGQYIIKQPTLYSCLKRLEVQGFVKSYWGSKSIGGRKKYFTLTDLGRELFIRNKNDWDYSRDVINKLISDDDYSATYDDTDVSEQTSEDSASLYAADEFEEVVQTIDETSEESDLQEESVETDESYIITDNEDNNGIEKDEEIFVDVLEDEGVKEELDDTQNDAEKELLINVFDEHVDDTDEISDSSDDEFYSLTEEENYPINEPTNYEDENEDLPLSAAEQNYINEDSSEDFDDDVDNTIYYSEENHKSYISNVGNTEYEPPKSDEINVENYFDDVEYYEEESASSVSTTEKQVVEDEIPHENDANVLPSSEFTTFRRVVNDTPKENNTVFYSYKHGVPDLDEKSAIIDKEYRGVISKLISDNIVMSEPNKTASEYVTTEYYKSQTQTNNIPIQPVRYTEAQKISDKLADETGDKVDLRTHNDKAIRVYNNKHFYYSNQLRLLQCGILFGVMLFEIIACFYFIEVLHNGLQISKLNLGLYIAAVILTAIFPINAFIMASSNYYKRKRINYSGKSSAIFSIVAFILLTLIVVFANIYGGILIGNINNYLSSLIMPIVLSTNIVINAIIFHCLYTSGKYNIEE